MPPTLDIKTRLVFTGPQNVKPVVDDLRRKFGNINVPIKVTIDARSSSGITTLNKKLAELTSNLKISKAASDDLSRSLSKLGSSFNQVGSNKQNINNIQKTQQAIAKVRDSAKASGSELEKFGQSAAFAIRRFSAFTVAVGAVFGFVRALQTAVSEAIDFEKQLTKIAQVQGSRAGVRALSDEITRLSTTLGVSSKELVGITDVLVQAGITGNQAKKALSALAKTTLAPTFNDIKNTTEAAIAAMAQFKLEASDLESVFGSINAVAAAFAAEAEDLTTVIRKTGSVFASAGSQLDDPKKQLNELLALFTAVRSTTRESADTIATGFRTIFSRLQRPDTIQFLRNFNIELADSENKFVGVFEAVRRLNIGLSGFQAGDLQFAEIIKQLAGRGEQISKVIPLIKEFPKALDALNVANKGTNSLTRDQILAQETLANSISRVREEFLALIRGITETDSFKIMAKSVLGLASALIKVAETLKPVLPLITALAAVKLASGGIQFARGFANELHVGGAGKLNKKASGGFVPGSGTGDSVLSALTPGEFIIPKGAAQKLGPKLLGRLQKFAKGGAVGGSGRLAITSGSNALEFDVRGAAQAIQLFSSSVTEAAVTIAQSEARLQNLGTALGGGKRQTRDSFTTKLPDRNVEPPVGTLRKLGLANPIAPIRERRQGPGEKIVSEAFTDRDAGGPFQSTRLKLQSGFNFRGDGSLEGPGKRIKPDLVSAFAGRSSADTLSPQGDSGSAELLLKSSAVLKKLPNSLKVYDDALNLITDQLKKGISAEKAGQTVRAKLLNRSIKDLAGNAQRGGSGAAIKSGLSASTLSQFSGSFLDSPGFAGTAGSPKGPGILSRAGTRLKSIGGRIKSNVTSQNGINALGAGAFLAAGQLEGKGRVGSSLASGLGGGLAAGTLTAGVAGGPAGAAVGVTVGIIAGLDRFASETNRIAQEIETQKFDSVISRLAESLKNGTKNVDQLIGEGRGTINKQKELDTSSGRSLDTLVGTGLGKLADFITGGQTIGGDSHSDIGRTQGASGLIFEEFANLFGTQNRGNFKQDEALQKKQQAQLEQLANPQFENIKKQIGGGKSLSNIKISDEQRKLFVDAGKDFTEILNAEKIRASQESLSKLVSNIELLGTHFDKLTNITEASITSIERFGKEQEEASNAFSGGRLSGASSRASGVLGNIHGFSNKAVSDSLHSSGADARTKSIIESGKRAIDLAPHVFQGINTSGSPGQIKADLANGIKGLKLDKAIEDTILHDIRELDITGDGEQEFREKFKELGENLSSNINKILDPAVKSAQALAKKQEAAANLYIEGLNRLADAQSNLRSTIFDSSDTKLDATRSIASAQGRNLTGAEERSALNAKTSALGVGGPAGLGGRISALRANGAALLNGRNATAPGSAEFKGFTDKLAANNDELDRAQKALELFAKDTTLAGIAADKLQKVEAKRAIGREVAGGILGGDKLGFAKKINALGRFNAGDNKVLSTSFEDVQSGVDLQSRFLRANGRGKEADAVEANFDKKLGEVLGPEMAKLFKSVRDEEVKAKADQIAAAKIQITAANESIKASTTAVEFYKARVGGGRARGGMIRGAGTSTSDSIPARLSDGEYIFNAAAVRNIGVDALDDMNATGFARGGIARRATRGLLKRHGFDRGLGHRGLMRNGRLLSPFNAARHDLGTSYQASRTTYAQRKAARSASFRRRRGFASGGLVEGGGGGVDVSGLSSFAAAANNLANALNSVNIPSVITMTGTHQVNVVLNGASVLNDLLNGPLSGLIRGEIEKAMSKYDRDLKS